MSQVQLVQILTIIMFISGTIQDLSASSSGELCCSVADDKTMKVFDVINFGEYH